MAGRAIDYGRRYRETGTTYSHPVSQLVRFESVLRHADIAGKSVLDVGCGDMAFARFLAGRGVYPGYYRGVDGDRDLLAAGRPQTAAAVYGRFPWHGAFAEDWLVEPAHLLTADVVVCVGVLEDNFGLSARDLKDRDREWVGKLWRLTQQSLAFTLMSVDHRGPDLEPSEYLTDPAEVYAWVRRALKIERVLIDASYCHHAYTVVCHRGPTQWDRLRGEPRGA